ncbi:hypothetical protein GF351_03180 [Candidatus Woesearchaeota archaeon]|nr:hypothetical protein [Candidatus Woesearchaeota archaeon]
MGRLSAITYIVIGAAVAVASFFLGKRYYFFMIAGSVFVGIGVVKFIFAKKNSRTAGSYQHRQAQHAGQQPSAVHPQARHPGKVPKHTRPKYCISCGAIVHQFQESCHRCGRKLR